MKRSVMFIFISILLVSVLALSSCHLQVGGYAIGIIKLEELNSLQSGQLQNPDTSDNAPIYNITDETMPPEEATGNQSGIQIDTSYQQLAMSAYDVIELYKRATADVKARAPGYIRSRHQEISDVEGGDGTVQLVNRVLNLVGTEVLKASGDEEDSVQINPHDDIAVLETFPMFNKEVGCELTDMSIVKSAVCYSDGVTYKIIITFDDQLNPDPVNSSFAQIMTPVDRNALSDPIEEYLVVLDMNSYQFDINYTNCEITCIIDKATSRMTSLKHKMIMDINIVMNLDLIVFQTNNVKASGRIVNFLEYYNFDWS